jgi:tetratricopeptide (TPR) repeat protein
MRDAEEALRIGDLDMARTNYWGALRFDPMNIIARMRLGIVLKNRGEHYQALQEFITVTKLAPNYGEAWKERGIVEGLIARMIPVDKRRNAAWLSDGYDSLKRATLLNPEDFDAWSSLGGVLKNVRGDVGEAKKMYFHASDISAGHPYPLLNALKMEALDTGKLDLEPVREQLECAKQLRLAQTLAVPPVDTPWCYFDLAEIHLYQNDKEGFLDYIRKGLASCNADWQPKTFRESLQKTLVARKIDFEGLSEGIKLLDGELVG